MWTEWTLHVQDLLLANNRIIFGKTRDLFNTFLLHFLNRPIKMASTEME